jgi:hypothetical protein
MAINKNRKTNKKTDTIGNFINAGRSPESIKYSIAPKTAKKIRGTLTYTGINFFIFIGLKIIMLNCHSKESDLTRLSFLFYRRRPKVPIPQRIKRKSTMIVLDKSQLLKLFPYCVLFVQT